VAASLTWVEDPDDDFPFYNGRPAAISGRQWCFVLAMVALGFAFLTTPLLKPTGAAAAYLAAILFPGVPLLGLAIVAPAHWRAIFRKVGWRAVMWMVLFALLNMLVSGCVGLLVGMAGPVTSNAAIAGLADLPVAERLLFVARTAPQLFGEEVVTILPFLAVMYLLTEKARLSRRQALLGAWLVSSAWFSALHLPTYGWNFVQCFVVIGSARLVLSLAYIKTKNIWVSTGAHIINDWTFFAIAMAGAAKTV
jgi:membrane protease YdiL (CAAX protease family)